MKSDLVSEIIETSVAEFTTINQFPNYEMLNEFPFTTIVKTTKAEVKPKKKNGYLSLRLEGKDHQFQHIIAGHVLNNVYGDKIKFKNYVKGDDVKNMLKNYPLDNITVK